MVETGVVASRPARGSGASCALSLARLALAAFALGVGPGGRRAAAETAGAIQAVPQTQVRLSEGFWLARLTTNRQVTIPHVLQMCEETGRIHNFEVAGGAATGAFRGQFPFDDSDLYKAIEGASYSLATDPDPKLEARLDAVIAKIAAAQEQDGYLMTWRTIDPTKPPTDWSGGPARFSNVGGGHELYNQGHLYEAAVAYFAATGKRSLLEVALKSARYVDQVFGPGRDMYPPGHEEIEIGLVKLWRVSGDRRFLDLARFFVEQRGNAAGHTLYGEYSQDHAPVVDQPEIVGHAVRATYLMSAVSDLYAATNDARYIETLHRLWDDMSARKTYLTGGIGARHGSEAFGAAYELPNREAYDETCAAIGNVLWNQRMFLLDGDSKYVDLLEQTLYNGVVAGVSLRGDTFFYTNPLESDGVYKFNQGTSARQPWFACACCPGNVTRILPLVPGFVYARRGDDLYVNLFAAGRGSVALSGGPVLIEQATRYPWDGNVRLSVRPQRQQRFRLLVRVPGWTGAAPWTGGLYRYREPAGAAVSVAVNGKAVRPGALEKGYMVLERDWKPGDAVELTLPMPPRRVEANAGVAADAGRVAVQRGPLVYCAEGADNGGKALELALPRGAVLEPEPRPDLLGGVTLVRVHRAPANGEPPRAGSSLAPPAVAMLVPYFAWGHRGVGEMAVWLHETP